MSERLIDRLSTKQIEAIFDALPLEIIFVDEKDRLQYYNKGEKRTHPGPAEVIGKDIRSCHQPSSMPMTNRMLDNFRNGKKDEDEFWIDGTGIKLLNRFFAARSPEGEYMGCVEFILNFDAMEQLAEDKKDAYRILSSDSEALDEAMKKH